MTISRDDAIRLIVRCRLAFSSKERIAEILDESEPTNESAITEERLFEELSEIYSGTSNGYLSDIYETISGEQHEVVGNITELFKCPCCGYKTLTQQYDEKEGTGYDICRYCGWEDDGTTMIDKISSVNKGSINEYRERLIIKSNYYYKNKWLT